MDESECICVIWNFLYFFFFYVMFHIFAVLWDCAVNAVHYFVVECYLLLLLLLLLCSCVALLTDLFFFFKPTCFYYYCWGWMDEIHDFVNVCECALLKIYWYRPNLNIHSFFLLKISFLCHKEIIYFFIF